MPIIQQLLCSKLRSPLSCPLLGVFEASQAALFSWPPGGRAAGQQGEPSCWQGTADFLKGNSLYWKSLIIQLLCLLSGSIPLREEDGRGLASQSGKGAVEEEDAQSPKAVTAAHLEHLPGTRRVDPRLRKSTLCVVLGFMFVVAIIVVYCICCCYYVFVCYLLFVCCVFDFAKSSLGRRRQTGCAGHHRLAHCMAMASLDGNNNNNNNKHTNNHNNTYTYMCIHIYIYIYIYVHTYT